MKPPIPNFGPEHATGKRMIPGDRAALRTLPLVAVLIFGNCLWPNSTRGQEPRAELIRVQREFLDEIRPILQRSCGDCHWGDDVEADLNFEPFQSLDQILEAIPKWQKALESVHKGQMPPEDSDPLPTDDRQRLLEWLDHVIHSIDCTEIDPGTVTIRRLNRTEYRNTIRDLTGIDFTPAKAFPGDDVGYGFDNIGDVLSLPPILLEKYFDAAEQILTQAIPDDDSFYWEAAGSTFSIMHANRARVIREQGSVFLASQTSAYRDIEFPRSGSYQLVLHAFGTQAGDELAKASIRVNKEEQELLEIDASRPDQKTYQATIRVKKGRQRIGIYFANDYYRPEGPGRGDRNLSIHDVWIVDREYPKKKPSRLIFERPGWLPREQQKTARTILRRFASFAFRRPVKTSELDALLELYQLARSEGDPFDQSVRYAMQAVLVSPHFLFKVEQPAETGTRERNQYELATSLSYFLWSTMPDTELFRIATRGDLSRPDVLQAQVERMLADPKSRALVENFASQWLQLRSLRDVQPDPELFPGVDRQLLGEMAWETKSTVADVFLNDRSILDLLTVQFTFVNDSLANHYGIEGVTGGEFQKVRLPEQRAGGILTHGSILTLTSNPTRTSPVKRGKWIMENFLADKPPPPDPSVMPLEEQPQLTGTLRERMEQHRADPQCASCHTTMDAIGFSLENFNAVGQWRELDDGLAIDATGTLEDGTTFQGVAGLQSILQGPLRDDFIRCFTEKLLTYSLGRGLQYYDQCSVDEIIKKAAKEDYRFSSFVHAIVTSEPFLKRRDRKK